MRTDEEIEEFLETNANEDGDVSDELMAAFLRGEDVSGDTKAVAAPDPAPEAEPEKVADPGEKAEDQPEPVILAKDGKHTIPYSELEAERERSRQAVSEAAQLRAKLEAIEKAEQDIRDADTKGNKDDEQIRNEALEQVEEEFPGFQKALESLLGPVQAKLDSVLAEKAAADAAQKEIEHVETLQQEFDKQVIEIEPRYEAAKEDPKFWEWFDKQPSVVKLAETSGDPQAVADVVKMYHAQASDTAKDDKPPKVDPKEAIAKAKEEPVVRSLSDVPGGHTGPADEDAAVAELSGVDLLSKMMAWTPDKTEQFLSRIL